MVGKKWWEGHGGQDMMGKKWWARNGGQEMVGKRRSEKNQLASGCLWDKTLIQLTEGLLHSRRKL